jgi:hypothetical protein
MIKTVIVLSAATAFFFTSCSAQNALPLHPNIKKTDNGYIFVHEGDTFTEEYSEFANLQQFETSPEGNEKGIAFDFKMPDLKGTLYYGFIPYPDTKHPLPVYFKKPVEIEKGKAQIEMADLSGKYDMIDWQEKGFGTIGYRVVNDEGTILYDGKVTFSGTGPFEIANTLLEGPYITDVKPYSFSISYKTSKGFKSNAKVNGQIYEFEEPRTNHELTIDGLKPNTTYKYSIRLDDKQEYTFSVRTAPEDGSREAFTFAYASDSRHGRGGGERKIYGANAYIMKKMAALAHQERVGFLQFSGDLINGYLTSPGEMNLQYANWRRSVEPFWHHFLIRPTMGNHESLMRVFRNEDGDRFGVDRFPYATESGEAVFAQNFSNPINGPANEDGSDHDPDKSETNFPSYNETVFHYSYANVGVIVLNSDYWYAPGLKNFPASGGNLHAYIMDNQLAWLKKTLKMYEQNDNIDHVFITQHTPAFPNGGHVKDDMWYHGNNEHRPVIAGKPVDKGIIERRDEYLDLLVNESSKVRAILTGDEHNYCRTTINDETPRYPENWKLKKTELSREIMQINNGAAGAPYYAKEETPWQNFTEGFTTQNALVLFDVEGDKIEVRVVNPDTLEEFDSFTLQ